MLNTSSSRRLESPPSPPRQPPLEDFAQLLAEINNYARHSLQQQRLAGQLTKADFRLLGRLEGNEGCSQSTLSDALDLGRSTVSRQIVGLAEKGFIERRPHPSGRRCFTLHLSPQAHAILATARASASKRSDHALRRLGPGEKAQLLRLLRVVLATLAEDAL